MDEQGTTTTSQRYIRQYYKNGQSASEVQTEDGIAPSGYSQTGNPYAYTISGTLDIGAMINTEEKGLVDAVFRQGGQDTTSRGDKVVWGYFYANPSDVSWGSSENPELFVKVWFDTGGRIDVNFFHVSVPDIEVYSDYDSNSNWEQSATTVITDRYTRHEYSVNDIDLTGMWVGTYTDSILRAQGWSEVSANFSLIQSGNTITGLFSAENGAQGTMNGTINGSQLNFTVNQTTPGCPGTTYSIGTIQDSNTITFTYVCSDCLGYRDDGSGTLKR